MSMDITRLKLISQKLKPFNKEFKRIFIFTIMDADNKNYWREGLANILRPENMQIKSNYKLYDCNRCEKSRNILNDGTCKI